MSKCPTARQPAVLFAVFDFSHSRDKSGQYDREKSTNAIQSFELINMCVRVCVYYFSVSQTLFTLKPFFVRHRKTFQLAQNILNEKKAVK